MEAVVDGGVYGMVASVGDPEVELLAVLLNLEDEVTGIERVVAVVLVVVVVVVVVVV